MNCSKQWMLGLVVMSVAVMSVGAEPKDKARKSGKDLAAEYTVDIISTKDKTSQKGLFVGPKENVAGQTVPLLVAFHTWSESYITCTDYVKLAQERGWACVAPTMFWRLPMGFPINR